MKSSSQFVLDQIGELLTLGGAVEKKGRNIQPGDLGRIIDAAMVISKGKIIWTGKRDDLPKKYKKLKHVSARGRTVMPGIVDSHTHLVFAGDRSQEFEMRLAGKTYSEIAQAGGGIVVTTQATREMLKKDLLALSQSRVENFLRQGVTTIEIKTGYGLSFESEKKCLEIIAELKKKTRATIKATYLAAHAVPVEFKGRQSEYIEVLANEWLPKLSKHADFADIFIDDGYFTVENAEILVRSAAKHKLPIKLHADELKLTGGTDFGIKCGALSCDHLLKISLDEIKALAKSETTATLLPTTAFFLNTDYAPARGLLDSGARVALASDFNPGTSPTQDISVVGILSALKMGMRIDEIIVAMTLNGAYALGLQDKKGALLPGYDADFLILQSGKSATGPAHLFYEFGQRLSLPQVFVGGHRL